MEINKTRDSVGVEGLPDPPYSVYIDGEFVGGVLNHTLDSHPHWKDKPTWIIHMEAGLSADEHYKKMALQAMREGKMVEFRGSKHALSVTLVSDDVELAALMQHLAKYTRLEQSRLITRAREWMNLTDPYSACIKVSSVEIHPLPAQTAAHSDEHR